MYYADPVKLDASERTVEFSAELCQQRCQVVPECSHFTFWPDPGTIWDDLGPSGTIWDDLGPGPSRDIAKRVIRCPQSTFSDFNFLTLTCLVTTCLGEARFGYPCGLRLVILGGRWDCNLFHYPL